MLSLTERTNDVKKAGDSSKLVVDILIAAFLLTSSRYVCTCQIRHTINKY